jgi:DNA (cytosine-5)-methyltransferase 1
MKYSYMDFFAGAGGWSRGFEDAGFQHLRMYDHNESACRTAEANFGSLVECVDLGAHHEINFPEADIVVGSPPCQGFSNEGRKDSDDPRNSLVWSFLDIVEKIAPRVWIFENVPGFQRSYGGKWFRALAERLGSSKYKWVHGIVDSADYGVPQHRKRFIIIAARDFRPRLPTVTHLSDSGLLGEMPHRSLWDALSDLPEPTLGDRVGTFDYSTSALNSYQEEMRTNSARIFNHTAQRHSERVLEKIRSVPAGGDMSVFMDEYSENAIHYMGGYRRATKHRPSWTAYWTRGMTSIHPEQHRFLTPRECARIQSFPDRHQFFGATIENYTQICNAVPPLLAKAIASSINEQLSEADSRVYSLGLEMNHA